MPDSSAHTPLGAVGVSGGDELYRRVPDKPDFVTTVDLITGLRRPTPAAFSYSDRDGDGLSVYVDRLLVENEIPRAKVCDWSKYGAARFSAEVIIARGGKVLETPDDEDPVLGKAHASIPKPSNWKAIRSAILASCRFFESGEECSSG